MEYENENSVATFYEFYCLCLFEESLLFICTVSPPYQPFALLVRAARKPMGKIESNFCLYSLKEFHFHVAIKVVLFSAVLFG